MCPECGSRSCEPASVRRLQQLGETIFGATLPASRCASCGKVSVSADVLAAWRRALAVEIAARGPVATATFGWLRSALPMSTAELARVLDVRIEELRRWERGLGSVDRVAWLTVAGLVLESIDPASVQRVQRSARADRAARAARTGATFGVAASARHVELDIERTRPPIRRLLRLLAGPVRYVDTAMAKVMGVPVEDVRAALGELQRRGVLVGRASRPEGWEWCSRRSDTAEQLLGRARAAGLPVDGPIPRAPARASA